MTLRHWFTLLILSIFSLSSWAQYIGPKTSVVTTVAAARQAVDDTPVVLEGHIVRQIKDEQYEFKDNTGKITVEIDNDKWPSQITHNDRVRIYGEVDRGMLGIEIDVDRVEILAPAVNK